MIRTRNSKCNSFTIPLNLNLNLNLSLNLLSLFYLFQRLFKIGNNIIDVFDPD